MQRLVKKLLVGIAVPGAALLILVLILNSFYVKTDYYKNLNGVRKFHNLPEHITAANFGNSHSSNGFDWSVYSDKDCANMALASLTLVYDEAIFDYYYDKFDRDSTIIVVVSFRTLYEQEKIHSDKVKRYYQFLDSKHIMDWNVKYSVLYSQIPILGNFTNAVLEFLDLRGNATKDNPDYKNMTEKNRQDIGAKRAELFIKDIGSLQLGIQYDALVKIIDKCKQKQMQLVLVTMPTTPYFYENFTDEFYNKFYSDIEDICELYDRTVYLDYTKDERFVTNLDIFRDQDHMNASGAELFTLTFIEDLKKQGISIG